jgi:hypothetical protein
MTSNIEGWSKICQVFRGEEAERTHELSRVPEAGELAGTHQPGELEGITPVGFHAIDRLFGNQGRGDNPIAVALFRQIAIEPIATGAGFIDKDEVLALRQEASNQFVDIALSSANGAKVGDLGLVFLGHVSHGYRLFMDIQSDEERARLGHG